MNTRGGSSVGRASGLHPEGRRFDPCPLHQLQNSINMSSDKDLEDILTEAILDLLIDAKENGLDMLSFTDLTKMLGVDDTSLMTKFEQGMAFQLNHEFIEKLKDPEVRQAMIESFKATKH